MMILFIQNEYTKMRGRGNFSLKMLKRLFFEIWGREIKYTERKISPPLIRTLNGKKTASVFENLGVSLQKISKLVFLLCQIGRKSIQ